MRKNHGFLFAGLIVFLVLCGCKDEKADDNQAQPARAAPKETVQKPEVGDSFDDWGRGLWKGPEGTWMRVLHSDSGYQVLIKNLDGVNRYQGHAVADGVEFERDGKTLKIRAGTGKDTGMKYLTEKQDCLVVDPNEGYCRD